MRKNMLKNTDKRLEQNYAEAVALLGNINTIYKEIGETVGILINKVASRIEWKDKENYIRRKEAKSNGLPVPALVTFTEEAEELERLSRVVSTIQGHDADRTDDPNAGIGGLVKMLLEARKEMEDVKAEISEKGDNKVPPEAGEGGAGDKICQTPTIEQPPALGHIIANRGKVRRGSG
jgi:hypothetical protein